MVEESAICEEYAVEKRLQIDIALVIFIDYLI